MKIDSGGRPGFVRCRAIGGIGGGDDPDVARAFLPATAAKARGGRQDCLPHGYGDFRSRSHAPAARPTAGIRAVGG
ncbi:MAG TPA: hypothetical protein PLU30_14045 [Verrucomicrobiae bacterium]|nr:hypothetical protein [Verrucomicrobiae bacterium]